MSELSSSVPVTLQNLYNAFVKGDRETFESYLADGFTFTSPDDPKLDRDGYFEKCWPHSKETEAIEIEKILTDGETAFMRYRAKFAGRPWFRNTEYFTFDKGRVKSVEVYYGMEVGEG